MTTNLYRRECVQEAIFALGYIRPESVKILVALMTLTTAKGAQRAAAHYRSQGEQLSPTEKKALGLRRAAPFSRVAADDLTAKGMCHPLQAHETTLMRAVFNERRFHAVAKGLESGADFFLYSPGASGCDTCNMLRKLRPTAAQVDPSHPRDCRREACPVIIVPQLDHRLRYMKLLTIRDVDRSHKL